MGNERKLRLIQVAKEFKVVATGERGGRLPQLDIPQADLLNYYPYRAGCVRG